MDERQHHDPGDGSNDAVEPIISVSRDVLQHVLPWSFLVPLRTPAEIMEIEEKSRCSILFHLLVAAGRWQTVMARRASLTVVPCPPACHALPPFLRIPDAFFLLTIDGNDRLPLGFKGFVRAIDMLKLGIPVGMRGAKSPLLVGFEGKAHLV